jgi:nitroimidazol reductase NimA-like FMN-containing flavoprotein (pyridoxamine 5'-phosphate oxidase superfamily)
MLEVREMSQEEIARLLGRGWYGHLGCARDGHPYVVPMSYAYDGGDLYFFTTEGTKTEFIAANREVCFQVEEVESAESWQSVMLTGRAELLSDAEEIERAMFLVSGRNPSLSPALARTRIGAWTRLSRIALYRLRPEAAYGRRAEARPTLFPS